MRLFLTSRFVALPIASAARRYAQETLANRPALLAAAPLGKSPNPDYRRRPRVLALAGVF